MCPVCWLLFSKLSSLHHAHLAFVRETRAEVVHPIAARIDARKAQQRVPRAPHNHALAELDGATVPTLEKDGLLRGKM